MDILAGLTIGKGILDFAGNVFGQSDRKSRLDQIIGELKVKENELRKRSKTIFNETYLGSLRAGMNFVNQNVPQAAGYLNPNLRKANFTKVGAETNMQAIQNRENLQAKADEAFYKSLGIQADNPAVNMLDALSDAGTEVLGGMLGIEQIRQQEDLNQQLAGLYSDEFRIQKSYASPQSRFNAMAGKFKLK